MNIITRLSGMRQLFGTVIGYLAGEKLVEATKLPQGLPVFLGIVIIIIMSAMVVVVKYRRGNYDYPRGTYERQVYKFAMGQLGAWLLSLLIGGFLPLLKSFAYSGDFWTTVLLVPWAVGIIFVFLVAERWFDSPRPLKQSEGLSPGFL